MHRIITGLSLIAALAISSPAGAALDLSFSHNINISALALQGVGGMDFQAGRGLWISDAKGGSPSSLNPGPNTVNLISTTGLLQRSFNALPVGIGLGPDALAFNSATGNVHVFSAFGEVVGGIMDSSGGVVSTYAASEQVAGAAFNAAGDLWVASIFKDKLLRIDAATGTVLQEVLLTDPGLHLSGLSFDPHSGNLFAFDANNPFDVALVELDLATGGVLSRTTMNPFLGNADVPAGMSFNDTGTLLYIASLPVASPSGTIVSNIQVLERTLPLTAVPLPAAGWLLFAALGALAGWGRLRRPV